MTTEPAKLKPNALRRIGAIVLPFVVLIVIAGGSMLTRPLWDSKHYKWAAGPGPSLSIVAYESNFGIGNEHYDPTLRITCAGGQPNLELTPVITMMCLGDCSKGGSISFHESFRSNPKAAGSLFFIDVNDKARYHQDVLSNPPSDYSFNAPPSPIGVAQSGSWWLAAKSTHAERFDYGEYAKDDADVYRQARNYIERVAAAKDLELEANGYARFDTRDLKSKLASFWAACPAPNAAASLAG